MGFSRIDFGVRRVSEAFGFQMAVFTPNLSIPVPLLFLWLIVQVVISALLAIVVVNEFRLADFSLHFQPFVAATLTLSLAIKCC